MHYGLPRTGETLRHGRGARILQWTRCSVRCQSGRLPDGTYFLYTDEGQVHQVKSAGGKWQCLAIAA